MTASQSSLHERLGGAPGIAALVGRFFAQLESRPEAKAVRAMHQPELEPMVGKLASFLSAWLRTPGRTSTSIIPLAHWSFPIGPTEVEQWLACMRAALADVDAEPEAAADLMERLEPVAVLCRSDADTGPF